MSSVPVPKNYIASRRSIRFPAERNSLSWMSLQKKAKDFHQDFVGLTIDESAGGCCIIFRDIAEFEVGKVYSIAVGNAKPVACELRWVKEVAEGVVRCGVEFLK